MNFDRTTGREAKLVGNFSVKDASERRFEPFNNMPAIASKYKRLDKVAIRMKQ